MNKMIRQTPLFTETATAGDPPKADSGSPPVEIEVDGVKMTPKQAAEELSKAKAAAADNKTLFDPEASSDAREGAARRHLSRLGYTKEQIDSWVVTNITGPAEEATGATPTSETKKDAVEGEEVSKLRKQVNQMRSETLNASFNNHIEKVMLSSPEIKNLLSATARLRGEENVAKVRERIAKSLKAEALRNISARVSRTGEEVSTTWLGDEVGNAVREVVEQHSAVIGDPSTAGRSAETSTSTNPFANRKKAPEPSYDSKKSLGQIEQEAIAFFTDDLIEAVAQMPSPKGGSKV